MAGDLDGLLRSVVPPAVTTGWRRIDPGDVASLTIAERRLVSQAQPKRQAEFASGRRLLRSLIGRDEEILRQSNGAPVLPDDFVASIAHDDEVVIGVVGAAARIAALGVDLEPIRPLERGVRELVVRADDQVPDALTAFVAKEAIYKAWSTSGGDMLEHHDVVVDVSGAAFTARVRGERTVFGSVARSDTHVVAAVVIPSRRGH